MVEFSTQRIQRRAENKVKQYILSEVKRVNGKFDALLTLANTALTKPKGIIEHEIYPNISPDKLKAIVNDLNHSNKWFQNAVKLESLSLYSHNNRRLVWALLDGLKFATNHKHGNNLLTALQWLRTKRDKVATHKAELPSQEEIPAINAIAPIWLPLIKNPEVKFNICAFELAIFECVAKELSCKNIWVEGSYRYRDPSQDFTKDFEENKEYYYKYLDLPEDANAFIIKLQKELTAQLQSLNSSILLNPKVVIAGRGNKNNSGYKQKGVIKISPALPQDEPVNLKFLHQALVKCWPNISLMDVLKEADLQIGFTKYFPSFLSKETLNKESLRRRLLLCIYGLGTNTGLKRISFGEPLDDYTDLRYVKRTTMGCQNVRNAIGEIVNAILKIRDPKVWGEQTTGCACDSKKVSVWDQNLNAEWHVCYGGRGVMIYWHVDKKACVVFSQIKTCSSSEVGAMIRGVLEHDTLMEMREIYVDTHGQSTIGFACSYLLHFDLLPRLKNINKQKLFVSKSDDKRLYPNLEPALATAAVNWHCSHKPSKFPTKYTLSLTRHLA